MLTCPRFWGAVDLMLPITSGEVYMPKWWRGPGGRAAFAAARRPWCVGCDVPVRLGPGTDVLGWLMIGKNRGDPRRR